MTWSSSRGAMPLFFLEIGMRVFWMLGWAWLAGCGLREMGADCSDSNQCADGGLCLKGVCSGYTCAEDADCSGGLICGQVLDVPVCAQPCEGDEDCQGQQVCTPVEAALGDTGAENLYCM